MSATAQAFGMRARSQHLGWGGALYQFYSRGKGGDGIFAKFLTIIVGLLSVTIVGLMTIDDIGIPIPIVGFFLALDNYVVGFAAFYAFYRVREIHEEGNMPFYSVSPNTATRQPHMGWSQAIARFAFKGNAELAFFRKILPAFFLFLKTLGLGAMTVDDAASEIPLLDFLVGADNYLVGAFLAYALCKIRTIHTQGNRVNYVR